MAFWEQWSESRKASHQKKRAKHTYISHSIREYDKKTNGGSAALRLWLFHLNMDTVDFVMKTFLSGAHAKLDVLFTDYAAVLLRNVYGPLVHKLTNVLQSCKNRLISLFTRSGPRSIVSHCKCLRSNHLSVLFFIRVTVIALKFSLEADRSWKGAWYFSNPNFN